MSDGINQTDSNNLDNYEDFRFRDAAQAIYFKYQMTDNIKPSDGTTATAATTTTSTHTNRNRQETIVKSRACTIL